MLLALRPGKFVDRLCEKHPSTMEELREQAKGYIQMKEYPDSGTKLDKPNKSTTIEKEAPRLTQTSWTRGTSPGMSVTHP